jgi:ferrochelatase
MPKGLLLLNLGTPDAPTPEKVRDYLTQFLMDPYVVDIPWPLRWLLVHGIILRKRPALSAEAYRKVWTDRGSPLLFNHLDLVAKVRTLVEAREFVVAGGMRYGNPSIEAAVRELRDAGATETIVFPLYPQYSLAATESSVVETRRAAQAVAPGMKLSFVPAFFESPPFIEAFAQVARRALQGFRHDHVLFSFHGLPERQVRKTDRSPQGSSHCLADRSCCDRIVEANRDCYRAQCFATARALAARLGLAEKDYSVSFQSRLGRTPWIKPYTDVLYAEFPKQGIKRLAVLCPAFVADCLETLEEIRIRGKEQFVSLGGEDLLLVESLNSEPAWAKAVVEIATA